MISFLQVHIDQDMEGEPIRALGLKFVLKHFPWLHVLNVWSPLETPRVRPLGMMSKPSLSARNVLVFSFRT